MVEIQSLHPHMQWILIILAFISGSYNLLVSIALVAIGFFLFEEASYEIGVA